ncbi:putative membrane protein [Proteiniphilum saccharofermentans]|uniref:Putative membrane protein n=2 Tax=Proteiniphilum saccharofermentans TaxID=1642647 RepID=A0A1R3SR50_9BACT|nr:putative membrane protein [Proteiniphilum saccharofermentans]
MQLCRIMVKKLCILFTFYRYYIWVSLLVNLICAFFLWKNGIGMYPMLFWFKIFTMGASFYLINDYRKQIYFYFHNFGLSKKVLWIFSLLFDLLLFFAMMILAYNLR